MKKEYCLRLSGKKKEEAYEALDKIFAFVNKKPEKKNLYRFMYVSIKYADGTEFNKSGGIRFKNDDERGEFESIYKSSKKMLDTNEITSFWISGKIEND